MAAPFSVEASVPGTSVWGVDAAGNTNQAGALTAGTVNSTAGTIGTLGAYTQNGIVTYGALGGVNTAAGVSTLTTGSIGAGTAALLGTAASGTQLADTTRDYMVYLDITAGGTVATLGIGPTSAATYVISALATVNIGTQISFRLPAGWFIRYTATAGFTQQSAVSC